MDKTEKDVNILNLSLHEITQEHGSHEGLLTRLYAEIDSTDWDEEVRAKIDRAIAIALDAHKDDTRGPHAYSTHLLRVAIRIISRDHFDIRDNPDLLTAALLHDTVEDHADYFVYSSDGLDKYDLQEAAIGSIKENFNDNVGKMVGDVTNPIVDKSLPKPVRNQIYQAHVRELLEEEPMSGIIKLSDFIDNCVGIRHNEDPEKAVMLAGKYIDLIPDFQLFVINSTWLSPAVQDKLFNQLERAKSYCQDLLLGEVESVAI